MLWGVEKTASEEVAVIDINTPGNKRDEIKIKFFSLLSFLLLLNTSSIKWRQNITTAVIVKKYNLT